MEHHRIGGQRRMLQVRIDLAQAARRRHRLVAHHLGGQRDHIEVRVLAQRELGAAAGAEQRTLESVLVHAVARLDEDLPHPRLRRCGQRAAGLGIHRHLAPAGRFQPFLAQAALQLHRRGVAAGRIEEHQARGEALAQRDTGLLRQRPQPRLRAVNQHAAAIAADAIGIHATAVGKFGERAERGVHHPGAGTPVDLRNQAEAAAVVLEARVVQSCLARYRHYVHLVELRCAENRRRERRRNACTGTSLD